MTRILSKSSRGTIGLTAWQHSPAVLGWNAKGNLPMTINLPGDLERFIQAEVRNGHFASEEDAIATAIRLLRQQVGQPAPSSPTAAPAPDPVLGAMRDAADEMDEIVAEAMKCREQQPWRLYPGE